MASVVNLPRTCTRHQAHLTPSHAKGLNALIKHDHESIRGRVRGDVIDAAAAAARANITKAVSGRLVRQELGKGCCLS